MTAASSSPPKRGLQVGDRVHSNGLGGTVERVERFRAELYRPARVDVYVRWDTPNIDDWESP